MKISIGIEITESQCSSNIVTLNVPGLNVDIWICFTVFSRFAFWTATKQWAVHLV